MYMASLNARAVALEVLKTVENGGKVNHRSLLLKHGYSDKVSRNPHRVTTTKSYMAVMKNVTGAMEKERARILDTMMKKDISAEKYSTLVQSADIITKNIQLLSGKATENVAMVIEVSEAIANKNKAKKNTESEKSQTV